MSFIFLCTDFSSWYSVSVIGGSDTVDGIRHDNDGCDRRYRASVRRGRHWISFGYILDITLKFILYSCLLASAGILVYRAWHNLPFIYTLYVLAFNFVFNYKSERSILGYSRSASKENKEGWHKTDSYILHAFVNRKNINNYLMFRKLKQRRKKPKKLKRKQNRSLC